MELYATLPTDWADTINISLLGNDTARSPSFQPLIQLLDRYLTTLLCAVGCLGNLVNVLVLLRMRQQDGGDRENVAQTGLLCLAVSDELFCVVLLPRGLFSSHKVLFPAGFQLYYQAYGTWLVTTCILSSTWITVVIAGLRYVAICHPLYARRVERPLWSKLVYTAVVVLSVAVNLPSMWQYQITHFDEDLYLLDIGTLGLATGAGQAYAWLKAVIGVFVPAAALVFCTVALVAALRRSRRLRRGCYVRATPCPRSRITGLLITLAAAFVLLVFPSELMDFFHDLLTQRSSFPEATLLARSVANILQVANFSGTFAIYCALNVHFRAVVGEAVRCRWLPGVKGRESGGGGRHSSSNNNGSLKTATTLM